MALKEDHIATNGYKYKSMPKTDIAHVSKVKIGFMGPHFTFMD